MIELFEGSARYRCAYGGRGSGKTRSFARMLVIKALEYSYDRFINGTIMCARESMKSLKDSSMSEIKHAIKDLELQDYFLVGEHYIKTSNGKVEFSFDGLRQNVDNIKSKARILVCWIDEADNISENSWQTLIPTIREEGSEIWVTWNPKFEHSATDDRFIKTIESLNKNKEYYTDILNNKDSSNEEKKYAKNNLKLLKNQRKNYKIIKVNYVDNPWFPETLIKEMESDKLRDFDLYRHVWLGEYITGCQGSYYASHIQRARDEGRFTIINYDRMFPVYAFWDIGGTGRHSDATSIWITQFVEKEIHIIDYYEAQGQTLGYHINWLRSRGYETANMILPHDGKTNDRIYDVSYESELIRANFSTEVIKNQGAGAAMARIEATRKLFDRMIFNERMTIGGVKALEWYHEKRDEVRNIGLGPNHDWSSHAADAFGLMSIYYKEPRDDQSLYNLNYRSREGRTWQS